MNPATTRSLLQLGFTGAGALLGGPLGATIGGAVGSAVGSAIPNQQPQHESRVTYPELSPLASVTRFRLPRPTIQSYLKTPPASALDRVTSVAAPLATAVIPGLMNKDFKGIMAEGGMFLSEAAPTHEEGGVQIEAEGGELILNSEQLAYINAATSPEEMALRFQEIQQMHMQNPVAGGVARGGAFVSPTDEIDLSALKAIPTRAEPLPPFHGALRTTTALNDPLTVPPTPVEPLPPNRETLPFTLSALASRSDLFNVIDTSFLRPFQYRTTEPVFRPAVTPNLHSPQGLLGNRRLKMPFSLWFPEREPVEPAPSPEAPTPNPFDDAIAATEFANKWGNISDMAKAGIHLGSLLSPETPMSPDFVTPPIKAPYYSDMGGQLRGDLDQSMALGISAAKELPHELRIAYLANLINQRSGGLREIAKHQTEVSNLNEAADAERMNKEAEMSMQMELANYQKKMQENQFEHLRKQTALGGLFQSADGIITRMGQAGTNLSKLKILSDVLGNESIPEHERLWLAMDALKNRQTY